MLSNAVKIENNNNYGSLLLSSISVRCRYCMLVRMILFNLKLSICVSCFNVFRTLRKITLYIYYIKHIRISRK